MVLTVYRDLNVCDYGRPMLTFFFFFLPGQNKLYHIKLRLLQFVSDFDNGQKCTSAS